MIDDGFPPTRDEWIAMRDRARFSEDRIRIIREVFGKDPIPWFPGRWLKMLHRVKAAIVQDTEEVPEP
jgi:hypothetical protein